MCNEVSGLPNPIQLTARSSRQLSARRPQSPHSLRQRLPGAPRCVVAYTEASRLLSGRSSSLSLAERRSRGHGPFFTWIELDRVAATQRDRSSFHVFAESAHSDVRGQIYNLVSGGTINLPDWPEHVFLVTGISGVATATLADRVVEIRPLAQLLSAETGDASAVRRGIRRWFCRHQKRAP
jgi:hypothetical protein